MSNTDILTLFTDIETDVNNEMLINFYKLTQQSDIIENTDIILDCLHYLVENGCDNLSTDKLNKFIQMNYIFVNFLQCIK